MRACPPVALLFAVLVGLLGGCRVEPSVGMNTFPLEGLHEGLVCEDCHDPGEPIGPLATDCASCHADDAPPEHYAGPCEECHDVYGWDNAVDHSFFPLDLSHDLDCAECHTTPGEFEGLSPLCGSCHEVDRPQDHFAARDCGECHGIETFDLGIDHSYFPLRNAHDLACETCHTAIPDFTGITGDCASCHETDRPAVDHFAGRDCGTCHTPTAWDTGFDHSFFPLNDAHSVQCESCHTTIPDFTGLSGECANCHEVDRPVDHHAPRDCGVCHAPTAWGDATDHSFFPLLYGHTLECDACHTAIPDFTGLDGECVNCHLDDRPTPDHYGGQECGACHTPEGWSLGVDHSFFPLAFSHALACDQCHTAIPVFTGLDGACSDCHAADRPTPDHYPAFECGGCHQITTWTDGLDHSFFALENAHALECDRCHTNIPDFTGNSSACTSCHESDRPTPDHFVGQDCSACHSPSTWAEAVGAGDHSFFPLENSHALECDNCHVNAPVYTGLSQACNSCHEVHRPGCHFDTQSCGNCHAPTGTWAGTATSINHRILFGFPVPHRNANLCEECHTTPNTNCVYDCLDCHGNEQNHHNGVNGFQNNSIACVNCHPTGQN
ncbi:MAG: hypothetical protein KC656_04070 [Myxococcales bacterium]|nr:hypothetical protein [Myxococcales bacterium]MCB9694671.1 hypothetical protein [Alphaproteobacteria bacterium]